MWKKLSEIIPEVDNNYLNSDKLFASESYYYRSKPIIIYARQEDNWAPNVFYIGYWIRKVTVYTTPNYRSVTEYFQEYHENITSLGGTIEKNAIDYWDYYNGDLPDFMEEK